MSGTDTPAQIGIALGWLAVFFAVYLVLPVLYALVKKINAQREDVGLVLANAAATFYYLWNILFDKFRVELAFCAVGLCVAHLVLMTVATKRCKDDIALRLSLLVIGLFFLTIAVPLYLKMYAVAIAWAAEGVVLTIIGLRYKSIWTQLAGAIALVLSLIQLILQLPMHKAAFQAIFNPPFGSWCFLAAAILVCHIIYRRSSQLEKYSEVPQFFYGAACLLFFATVCDGVVLALHVQLYGHADFAGVAFHKRRNTHFVGVYSPVNLAARLPEGNAIAAGTGGGIRHRGGDFHDDCV